MKRLASNRKYDGPCPSHTEMCWTCMHCRAMHTRDLISKPPVLRRMDDRFNGIGFKTPPTEDEKRIMRNWFTGSSNDKR